MTRPPLTPFGELVRTWQGACAHSIPDLWCGCGRPERAYEWVRDALRAVPREQHQAFWAAYPEGAQAILFSVLDRMGLVEHGGAWYSAWLTPEGQRVLAILDDVDDFEAALDGVLNEAVGCYMDRCDCGHGRNGGRSAE